MVHLRFEFFDFFMNNYKQRNYGDRGIIHFPVTLSKEDYFYSNMLYDQNKGKTHDFLHTNKGGDDDFCRIISDIEICMSTDPSVTSFYPAEYRQSLMNSIKGMGSKSQFSGLSDDEILESGIRCHDARELDENVSSLNYMSSQISQIQSQSQSQPQSQSQSQPQPQAESSKSE